MSTISKEELTQLLQDYPGILDAMRESYNKGVEAGRKEDLYTGDFSIGQIFRRDDRRYVILEHLGKTVYCVDIDLRPIAYWRIENHPEEYFRQHWRPT